MLRLVLRVLFLNKCELVRFLMTLKIYFFFSGRTPGLYPNMKPPHLKHAHTKAEKEDPKEKSDSLKKK